MTTFDVTIRFQYERDDNTVEEDYGFIHPDGIAEVDTDNMRDDPQALAEIMSEVDYQLFITPVPEPIQHVGGQKWKMD